MPQYPPFYPGDQVRPCLYPVPDGMEGVLTVRECRGEDGVYQVSVATDKGEMFVVDSDRLELT